MFSEGLFVLRVGEVLGGVLGEVLGDVLGGEVGESDENRTDDIVGKSVIVSNRVGDIVITDSVGELEST